jgi:tetratricopeptide (TPR) repeat protein
MLIDLKSSYLAKIMMMSGDRSKSLLLALLFILALAQRVGAQVLTPTQVRQVSFAVYQKAKQALALGDYMNCINLAKQAVQMGYGKDASMLIALAYAQMGDTYNANNYFLATLTMDYNFVKCRNNYGVFLFKTGKLDDARTQFETCIQLDPKYPDAYFHLGEVFQKRGDLEKAIQYYESAIRIKPDYAESMRGLGLAIYERVISGRAGEISESLEKLKLAAELSPDNPLIHYDLGRIYCADGKLDEGETEFRKALSIDPKFAASHYELGKIRYFRGDLDRCVLELRVAVGIPPTEAEAKSYPKVDIVHLDEMIGGAEALKARYGPAIEAYKEVASMQKANQVTLKMIKELEHLARTNAHKKAKISPEEVQAIVDRGIAQVEDGHLDQARATFTQGLALDPQSFECTQNLAALKENSGDLQGALSDYKKAMELLPKYDGVYYNMAYLLEKLGLPADAGMMYERFHEIAGVYPYDPKHIVALQQEDARQRAKREEIRKRGY